MTWENHSKLILINLVGEFLPYQSRINKYGETYWICTLSDKIAVAEHVFVLNNESEEGKIWVVHVEIAYLVPKWIKTVVG